MTADAIALTFPLGVILYQKLDVIFIGVPKPWAGLWITLIIEASLRGRHPSELLQELSVQ